MSVYGKVKCKMNNLERLQRAIELAELGAGVRVSVYPERNGVYRKYSGMRFCESGQVRGRNAAIVIHGGLDTSGLYSSSGVGGSGDTAFVVNPDGSITAELDINWHNGAANWNLIQNLYAALELEAKAPAMGCTFKMEIDRETGKVTGQFTQVRPVASRDTRNVGTGREVVTRRPMATRG